MMVMFFWRLLLVFWGARRARAHANKTPKTLHPPPGKCAIGEYKGGNNRRPCLACGVGFNTTGTAKISFADCYIPQGWGTSRDPSGGNGYVAQLCDVAYYGAASDTFGVKSLPCTPCPAGMTSPSGSNGPEDCITNPGWGYDPVTGTAGR